MALVATSSDLIFLMGCWRTTVPAWKSTHKTSEVRDIQFVGKHNVPSGMSALRETQSVPSRLRRLLFLLAPYSLDELL